MLGVRDQQGLGEEKGEGHRPKRIIRVKDRKIFLLIIEIRPNVIWN